MDARGRWKSFLFLQVEEWMRGKKSWLLNPFSYLWHLIVWLRHQAYRHQILSSTKIATPVINVGSISVGGVGKTPLVMKILEDLSTYKGALLTRGYRGGDEAKMVEKRYPHVTVKVGKNRLKNAKEVAADFFLLDDGWQYRKLSSDFSIAVLNSDFRNDHYLPRGRLRDLPSRIDEADLVVITHQESQRERDEWKMWLKKPLVFATYSWKRVLWQAEEVNLQAGDKVALFCGIGNPESFLELMREQKLEIVSSMILSDHEKPLDHHLERLIQTAKAKGAKALLCTEKDFVKLEKTIPFPVGMVEVHYNVIEGEPIYQSFLSQVRKEINARSQK